MVVAVASGSVGVGIGDTVAVLGHRLLGLPLTRPLAPGVETIIFDVRLPRVLTAMLVGGGLALAGTVFQALLRNPMADPYVIGTAAGASLGAIAGLMMPILIPGRLGGAGRRWPWLGIARPLAFAGGPVPARGRR